MASTVAKAVANSKPWQRFPAAMTKAGKPYYDNKVANWLRWFLWQYGWSGRQYGLQAHDLCFEPAPEVQEALRRLNLKEPWLYDERAIRLLHANNMRSQNERLPKEQWTQWDEETFYLGPYLAEIEKEKMARGKDFGSGLLPGFMIRQKNEGHH